MIKLSAYKLNIKLPEPISISFHTFDYRESVIIELAYKNLIGIGEAAPFKPITGDSQEEVIEQAKLLQEIPLNPEKDSFEKLHEYFDEKNIVSETLRAGVDFAYHDLLGKMKAVPVYKLYSPTLRLVDNSVTIFVTEDPKQAGADAKKVFETYPDLKILKIKLKGEKDVERANAIAAVAPAHIKYIIDANQGYKDGKVAVRELNKIGEVLKNVILVEQPSPKEDLVTLKYITDNIQGMMVFADESATTVADAKKVVDAKAAHGVNIKLQKAGGIWPSKQIAKMCDKAGMKAMVGCMLEGPIGIGAGVHFAVSTPNIILTDLDADLDMPTIATGKAEYIDGQRVPSNKPGLGIFLEKEKIKMLQKQGTAIYEKV